MQNSAMTKPNNKMKNPWLMQTLEPSHGTKPYFMYVLSHEQMVNLISKVVGFNKKAFKRVDELLGIDVYDEEQ